MQEIILATHNQSKVNEAKQILTNRRLLSLSDINYTQDIAETGSTLYENALLKVKAVFKTTGKACLADDTGLEVHALGGDPGVFSARYAGENATSSQNISKLLQEMQQVQNRTATFRTILAYMNEYGQYRFFEGIVEGTISDTPIGNKGFGYDPLFIPLGYDQTFAEMSMEVKNKLSHRKRALVEFQRFFEMVQSV